MPFNPSDTLSQLGFGIPMLNELDQPTPPGYVTPGTMQGGGIQQGGQGGFPISPGPTEQNLAEILGLAKPAPNQVLQAPVMGSKRVATSGGPPPLGPAALGPVEAEAGMPDMPVWKRLLFGMAHPSVQAALVKRWDAERKTDVGRIVTDTITENNALIQDGDLAGAEDHINERMRTLRNAPEAMQPFLNQIAAIRKRRSLSALADTFYQAAKQEVEGNPNATPLFKVIVAKGKEAEERAKKSGKPPDFSNIVAEVGEEGIGNFVSALANSQKTVFTPQGGGIVERNIAGTVVSAGDVRRPATTEQVLGNEYNIDAASLLNKDFETIRGNLTSRDPEIRRKAAEEWAEITTKAGRIRDVRALTHSERQNIGPYTERDLIDMSEEQYRTILGRVRPMSATQQGNIAYETQRAKEDAVMLETVDRALPTLDKAFDAVTKMQTLPQFDKFLNNLRSLGIKWLGGFPVNWAESYRQKYGTPPTKEERSLVVWLTNLHQQVSRIWPQDDKRAELVNEWLDPTRIGTLSDAADTMSILRDMLVTERDIIRGRVGQTPGGVRPTAPPSSSPLERRGSSLPPTGTPTTTPTSPPPPPQSKTGQSPQTPQSGSSSSSIPPGQRYQPRSGGPIQRKLTPDEIKQRAQPIDPQLLQKYPNRQPGYVPPSALGGHPNAAPASPIPPPQPPPTPPRTPPPPSPGMPPRPLTPAIPSATPAQIEQLKKRLGVIP